MTSLLRATGLHHGAKLTTNCDSSSLAFSLFLCCGAADASVDASAGGDGESTSMAAPSSLPVTHNIYKD